MTSNTTLAIEGGPPLRTAPWPPRRLFGIEEKQAAMALFDQCIETGNAYGYNGVETDGYCRAFVEYLNHPAGGHALMVNSGTTAVYVALRALDIQPFTEVIVPAITDTGGVMPVALINCIPVTADCAPGSYNIGPEQIAERITPRTSAIIVAHIGGIPADMDPILQLAREHNLPIIEDCAQAHGAMYKGRMVGSLGDIAAFSTMFGKHHATGGQGGVVFTPDEDRYYAARRAADRGKAYGISDAMHNVVTSLNFNQDEMGAAIGRVQLKKLPHIVAARRRIAAALIDGCEKLQAVRIMGDPPQCEGSYWFPFVTLALDKLRVDRATFARALDAEGMYGVFNDYLLMPTDKQWYEDRAVFGASGYPWSGSRYAGDPDRAYPTLNILETAKHSFRISMHENFSDRDIADTLAIFAKVERAYLR